MISFTIRTSFRQVLVSQVMDQLIKDLCAGSVIIAENLEKLSYRYFEFLKF